jgi:hypothetical protein
MGLPGSPAGQAASLAAPALCSVSRERRSCLSRAIWWAPMPGFAYRYELRGGEEVIATGRLTRESALEVGERITINARLGVVRSIEPVLGEQDLHVVIQLFRDSVDS